MTSRQPIWITGTTELSPEELPDFSDPIVANAVAIHRAAADADIRPTSIDAILTYDSLTTPHLMQATKVAEYAGITPAFASTLGAGGATPLFGVAVAAGLIRSGWATTVAIAHSDTRASLKPRANVIVQMANIVGNREFEDPFGAIVPTLYSLLASWLLSETDVEREDLATIAVDTRAWAQLNSNARMTTTLTLDDVLTAPTIAGPLGRYDCCLVTDFSGAVIVSGDPPETSRNARLVGVGGAATHEAVTQMPNDPLAPPRWTAERVYRDSGLGPDDVDVAFLYDSFTVTVALQVIAYGLDHGRGVRHLLSEVGIGPGGGFPVNTHGGLLSASTSGIFHLIEAVHQIRGEAGPRQIDGARVALVTGIGGVLSHNCALILEAGRDA